MKMSQNEKKRQPQKNMTRESVKLHKIVQKGIQIIFKHSRKKALAHPHYKQTKKKPR